MLYTKSKDFMKNTIENLDISMNVRTFAVLQSIINYAYGIFYTHKGTILKKYRQAVSVYYGPWAIIGCSKLGYLPVFCYLTQIISFHATTK